MHLLAGKPGGFDDGEGVVDLNQPSAPVVILAAGDNLLAALAHALEHMPSDFPAIRLANWLALRKPAAFDLYCEKTLKNARVVVVSVLGGQSYWPYGCEQLQQWSEQSPERNVVFVPGDDAPDLALMQASSWPSDAVQRVWRYFREGGLANSIQCLRYIAVQGLGCAYPWQEPLPLPLGLLYHPRISADGTQATLGDWHDTWQQCDGFKQTHADALLLFYRSHLQSGNVAVFDALLEAFAAQRIRVLPVAITSLKSDEALVLVNELLKTTAAKLVINTTGFASHTVTTPSLSSEPTNFEGAFAVDVPVLQLVLASSTRDDWQQATQGLHARDVAMQVVLPEMDGRVLTRAVSFKQADYWSESAHINVVRYQPDSEGIQWVSTYVAAQLRLASVPEKHKRLALVLANYPTKDGRIGNGVGLDTPASTVAILQALKGEGYPVGEVPETGTALIEQLLQSVTNNPNTIHTLPCWQSISLEDYQRFFAALPAVCQQAVLNQWGDPSTDPKYRNGRLMIAGIRIGETFVGIQPARGFDRDLAANYHSPDLVPPHSYLAFYFWLRHVYRVDAVIHVGKHGNLEWLPGKGMALSTACWPDIALGPTPHFYPFIVNDPGEGAQAKRRAQAVIIDHLMPPMTRAETYGAMATLEGYLDEYYQALGMDTRREQWLHEQILTQVNESHLLEELGCSPDAHTDTVLNTLDGYLCDIKEAQIRHGLHVLGALAAPDKLADTLVALLRLPRGDKPHERGLLHNIADDIGLTHQGQGFDPLQTTVDDWVDAKPLILEQITSQPWRTTADARERLEALAKQWVHDYVLGNRDLDHNLSAYPNIQHQLQFAKHTLLLALEQSATYEIQSLLDGLAGRLVAPGPSGAPTRGRLDTLPTGRNFFSVDNRAIPSVAAWALGERSADALIARHLQKHGDYPKQIGLSVWGTATMRTGGDDIAQAFALMGVKPVWAPGSQRVIDISIIPAQLLGRPRVDVTLRVSGFFRDAFANVMRLFDTAVQALANYDDPGGLNTVQHHIRQRYRQLKIEGADDIAAQRQASYRVFGSKPGAYGAGLQGLIDERCWQQSSDLAEAYLNWGGYAYGNDQASSDGVRAVAAFRERLTHIDTVVHNQDNREHDILDSDDYYQFQGGMINAVRSFANRMPATYLNDHANPAQPKPRSLKEELNRVLRTRVLNPKWINAMREHGYKGAFEMAATVDYLFAYDATTDLIADYQYQHVADALVFDAQNQAFMQTHNPQALEEMAERLLEATQRGMWQASDVTVHNLQQLLLDIDHSQEQSVP